MDRAFLIALRLFAFAVPRGFRETWRERWVAPAKGLGEWYRARGFSAYEVRCRQRDYARAAWYATRRSVPLPVWTRHPFLPIGIATAALIAVAVASDGFLTTRTMLAPPFSETERLVLVSNQGVFMGRRMGTARPLIEYWKAHNTSFEWLDAYDGDRSRRSAPMPEALRAMMRPGTGGGLVGAIGVLKRGVDENKAREELFRLEREYNHWRNFFPYPEPRVKLLTSRLLEPLATYGVIGAGTILILLSVALAGAILHRRQRNWKYWSYLAVKSLLVPGTLLLFVLELTPVTHLTPIGGSAARGEPFMTWGFVLACAACLSWSLADQHARCRSCLAILEQPVRIGFLGAVLFEHAGTETVCRDGHGALYVPDASSDYVQPGGWNPLNP